MFARHRILYLCMFVALVIMVIFIAGAEAAQPQILQDQSKEGSEMLQFTSSGHVLGFRASGAYVATGTHMLRERFVGTKGTAPQAERPASKKGQARHLGRVCYTDLWEGITLIYDAPTGGILRSTYEVEPWADPGQIGLCYNVPIHLDASNNLVFELETGTMIASAPVAWQEIDGERVPVDVAFRLDNSQSTVHFSLGQYNPAFHLTIDPTLSWNTFMGSSEDDYAYAIAVDSSGNVYVAGSSTTTWGSPVNAYVGQSDAFAVKINSSGERQWNTFMGSSDDDEGNAIDVDGSGNVYVAGDSDATWGSPVNAHAGGAESDAFVAKLDNSGITVWTTFMGSSDDDEGNAIAVDGSGNVYVAGSSTTTWGSPVNAYAGGDDAFVAKLDISGVSVWNTFMGSLYDDYGHAIALDGSGNVYVAGYSYDSWGSPVVPHTGGWTDAFAAKLNGSGVSVWNTFMGSSDWDYGYGIAVDESGNVYVAGDSFDTWGSPVNVHAGSGKNDAFASKLKSSGERQWNTFMGSSEYERGYAIAVDGKGNVYVGGHGNATWGSPVNDYAGGYDAFAVKLKNNGVLQWNTFMGSLAYDYGRAIAVDGKGNVYVAGISYATWGSPVNGCAGGDEAFAAKILKGALTPGIPLLLMDFAE